MARGFDTAPDSRAAHQISQESVDILLLMHFLPLDLLLMAICRQMGKLIMEKPDVPGLIVIDSKGTGQGLRPCAGDKKSLLVVMISG